MAIEPITPTAPADPALAASAAATPPVADFEETLKRLVDRIAKVIQAEKCVFLLHDPVAGTLYPTRPALGLTEEDLARMERSISEDGVSSEVFRNNVPLILYDALCDPRAIVENLSRYGVRNAVSVPLVVEKRDEDNRVLDRTVVGVLHVFNKRGGGKFTDEDVRLLQRMAMNAAAVISSAQVYREVVQEKQEFIQTIDSLVAGLLMVGMNGRLQQINPSARAILNIKPDVPLIGVYYYRAIHNDKIRILLGRALSSQNPELADEISIPATEDQSERIYQVQCAPVRDTQGATVGIVAIFNDITEIRGVERMKTAFISTVSHELRTPLTSIKGFISTLLADNEGFYDEPTRREFYEIIDTECDRLTRLIKDLLDISRIEQGRSMQMYWEQVDVVTLAQKVLSAQRAYTKDHVLSLDFSDHFPTIEADPDKIDQILTNLVNNAIKYSPRGGAVRVIGRHVEGTEGYVSIRIMDDGMGIPREHLPRLFERFYRVDNRDNREIGGTGIGLALVKALTEAHHGHVTVESEPGVGTTFTLILPISQAHISEAPHGLASK
ncbi:MAG: sensor signal transduction histidine kinase [Capsulimonas sp.]|jgi:signal transduction histidine kinase|nr:sensor signal transduction histidine kinase [Capsulimonas sp.]